MSTIVGQQYDSGGIGRRPTKAKKESKKTDRAKFDLNSFDVE